MKGGVVARVPSLRVRECLPGGQRRHRRPHHVGGNDKCKLLNSVKSFSITTFGH